MRLASATNSRSPADPGSIGGVRKVRQSRILDATWSIGQSCFPDFFTGPAVRPVARDFRIVAVGGLWRLDFDQILDDKAAGPQQPKRLAVRQGELDPAARVHPSQAELRTEQGRGCRCVGPRA